MMESKDGHGGEEAWKDGSSPSTDKIKKLPIYKLVVSGFVLATWICMVRHYMFHLCGSVHIRLTFLLKFHWL